MGFNLGKYEVAIIVGTLVFILVGVPILSALIARWGKNIKQAIRKWRQDRRVRQLKR